MQIFHSSNPLKWGNLDVPVLGITNDWFGSALTPPLGFSVLTDPTHLWFLATRNSDCYCHPEAQPGIFLPELWKYDVAELFLSNPTNNEYIELNLSPEGAWWAAKFTMPRVQSKSQPEFNKHISSHHHPISGDSWTSALSIPLQLLRNEINFNENSTGNVTAILNSPNQTFHSAHKLPGVKPDFHQPSNFQKLRIDSL